MRPLPQIDTQGARESFPPAFVHPLESFEADHSFILAHRCELSFALNYTLYREACQLENDFHVIGMEISLCSSTARAVSEAAARRCFSSESYVNFDTPQSRMACGFPIDCRPRGIVCN